MQSFVPRFSFLAILLTAGSVCCAQQPVGEVFASDATVHGSVQLSGGGTKVLSGASVTAGDAAAQFKLARGGEVRVCPGTSLNVQASPSGRELMLAIGSGALEADYKLGASADTILTPDFKILLSGPGTFHFALRSRSNGDTCVQTRASNGASLVLSEVMGDGSYQVKPNQSVLFKGGHLAQVQPDPAEDCGCPPAPATELAESKPSPPPPAAPVLVAARPALPAVEAPPPTPDPDAVHVQVDTPFVFDAERMRRPIPPPPAATRESLASLPSLPLAEALPPVTAVAVVQPEKKKKHWLRAFFAALFK
jgi:hypothetical protein